MRNQRIFLAEAVLGARAAKRSACLVPATHAPVTAAEHAAARGEELAGSGHPTAAKPLRIVIVSGVNVRRENEFDVDLALSKRRYAEEHGLVAFEFYVADWFGPLLAAHGIRQWEYVKIFMLQDALCVAVAAAAVLSLASSYCARS